MRKFVFDFNLRWVDIPILLILAIFSQLGLIAYIFKCWIEFNASPINNPTPDKEGE